MRYHPGRGPVHEITGITLWAVRNYAKGGGKMDKIKDIAIGVVLATVIWVVIALVFCLE